MMETYFYAGSSEGAKRYKADELGTVENCVKPKQLSLLDLILGRSEQEPLIKDHND
jgi:hypothetical protein